MNRSLARSSLYVLGAGFVFALTPAARAVVIDVDFSGSVFYSDDARDNSASAPFNGFAVGVPFTGSFKFDSSLILQHVTSTAVSSGLLDLYFSPVRDFHVVFDFGGGDTYRYDARPEITTDVLDFDPGSSSTWRIGDNVDDYKDEVALWVHNYPQAWTDDATEAPAVPVPASEYIDNLYPYAAFFELSDQGPKSMISSPNPVVDLNAVFANSTHRQFGIRFTDPAHASWKMGMEQIVGVAYGNITSLVAREVPEPATALLSAVAIGYLALIKRGQRFAA
jgi:hypothetical protein